jgi:hypothetical protein
VVRFAPGGDVYSRTFLLCKDAGPVAGTTGRVMNG